MRILLTGGTGYIGSHACVALLEAGHDVTVLDNYANSSDAVPARITRLAQRPPQVVHGDVRDETLLERLFAQGQFEAVMHFAGLKAVGESVVDPLAYYDNNVAGSITLLRTMEKFKVFTIVFSSSATVYGVPASSPVRESAPLQPVNPYGRTKAMVEQVLGDLAASDPAWRIACLRYFNPAGAHPAGLLGESPRDTPNNLVPYLAQVAGGQRSHLSVFGGDYQTADGTGVRDYIHVLDLVDGHLAALTYLQSHRGISHFNLGLGHGVSVLEMVQAFGAASGRTIPYCMAPRRAGDIDAYWADPTAAQQALQWQATRGIEDICRDAWNWRTNEQSSFQHPSRESAHTS